jgi:two-component system aerobic respiration control protein ArcA
MTKANSVKKKIHVGDLIKKIEVLTKSRMAKEEVVSLDQFRDLKKKTDPKTILVIEDDESMRASLQRIFAAENFIVKLASDATELNIALDESSPDLILMDVGLPWINGFELAQLMKEHRDLKKIPLVFISGQATDEDVKKGFQLGADDFVKKPFDIEKLKKTVNTLLGQ